MRIFFLFLFVSLLFLQSCKEERTRLNPNERIMVDTTFAKQMLKMDSSLSKICVAHHDSLLKKATDSIWNYQLGLIQKKIGGGANETK